jgi:hypothetical protein
MCDFCHPSYIYDANIQCQYVDIATDNGSGCDGGTSVSKPKRRTLSCHTSSTGSSMGSISVSSNAAHSKGKTSAKRSKVKSEAPISGDPVENSHHSDINGLPDFAMARWTTSFLPMLYSRLASALNPWEPYERDSSLVNVVQEIIDGVYPKSGYRVKLGDKIFIKV